MLMVSVFSFSKLYTWGSKWIKKRQPFMLSAQYVDSGGRTQQSYQITALEYQLCVCVFQSVTATGRQRSATLIRQ